MFFFKKGGNIEKNVIFAEKNMETGGIIHSTSNYDVIKSKHTKTGKDIWIVKPKERFDHTTYKVVEGKIKQNGGYYSSFVRGFVFSSDPNTDILDNIFGIAEIQIEKTSQVPYSQK